MHVDMQTTCMCSLTLHTKHLIQSALTTGSSPALFFKFGLSSSLPGFEPFFSFSFAFR